MHWFGGHPGTSLENQHPFGTSVYSGLKMDSKIIRACRPIVSARQKMNLKQEKPFVRDGR